MPPEAVTLATPVLAPRQLTLVGAGVFVAESAAAGCVRVTVDVDVQELLSVTVTVYVPAGIPDAVAVVFCGLVFHK